MSRRAIGRLFLMGICLLAQRTDADGRFYVYSMGKPHGGVRYVQTVFE